MPAWFETLDDRMWLRPDEGGEQEADFVRRALHLRKGQSVLDAPCGAGRMLLPLARRGIRVVGIDLRETFISRARARVRREGAQAELRVGDLQFIEFPERKFHGVFSWFNSFGYFSDGENTDLLDRYARALRPGGRLLIDQLNRERILREFRPEGENSGILYRPEWDARSERIHLRRIVDGVDDPRNRSSQRWYTPTQMRRLIERAGLHVERIYGSVHGEPFHRGSYQMVTVARKSL